MVECILEFDYLSHLMMNKVFILASIKDETNLKYVEMMGHGFRVQKFSFALLASSFSIKRFN
jgi:hypothetical protein